MFGLGITELIFIGIIAILLFGRNLPDVAKSMGRTYRDFRKGISEFTSEMDFDLDEKPSSSRSSYSARSYDADDYEEPTAPRFEPPKAEPREEPPAGPQA
jgi:sec-independent protein translocase protein TatA